MKKELARFVLQNDLNPFEENKIFIKKELDSIYKTRDAKSIHTKVINKISSNFNFAQTKNIWDYFEFTKNFEEIKKRQEFFKELKKQNKSFLKKLTKPRASWKPRYDIIVVTEDESTFVTLNRLNCGIQLLVSENDIMELEKYDIIQVIDCFDFNQILEKLPQTVFINSVEDVYLERYLEQLSGWRENFAILNNAEVSGEIIQLIEELKPLFSLLENKEDGIITETEVEKKLEIINEEITEKIKELTISGIGLIKMLSEGKMPQELLEIVRTAIENSKINEHIFNLQIPVTIDYKELEEQIKRQSATEFTDLAEKVKRAATELKSIPEILEQLSAMILIEDFCYGISLSIPENSRFPTLSKNIHMSDAKNLFLDKAQEISFQLDSFSKCSILTGANSGGKTTLLEHIVQNISLFQLGLPIEGEIHLPLFTDVYYFAKNKGSASKGAFETLLTQMAKIKPGTSTLILADEIEAVTEPGVAGKIISATAEYFIEKNCFIILATHLGFEIQKNLPKGARIDGIEAKGLDENFNLIVNHNPVLGRLAHSTPELIVERMANTYTEEYFKFLEFKIKN